MGWIFDIDKEPKQYETKGTVTISSEEYRDLVCENVELRVKAQKEHEDWYREYQRAESLEKEKKALKSKLDELNEWLSVSEPARNSFKEYKLAK